MSQIKEAIELIEKAKGLFWCSKSFKPLLDQALAKLRTEQPPLKMCPYCLERPIMSDNAIACEKCSQMTLISQPEQPPAGEPIRLERQNEILFEANRNIKVRLDRSEAIVKEYGGQRCTAVCSRCKRISHWCLLPQGHVGEHIHYCQFKFLEASREVLLTACEKALEFIGRSNKTDWDNEITPVLEVAIAKEKE